ncbi:MAG: hypothetical protein AB7S38_10375 [Vulcanimicrobiota bacterium]
MKRVLCALWLLLLNGLALAEQPTSVATVAAETGEARFQIYPKAKVGELMLHRPGGKFSTIWLNKSDWQKVLAKVDASTKTKIAPGKTKSLGFWKFDVDAALVTGGTADDAKTMRKLLKDQHMGLALEVGRDPRGLYLEMKINDFAGELTLRFQGEKLSELKKAAKQAKI